VTLSPNAGRVTEVDMAAEDSFFVLVPGCSWCRSWCPKAVASVPVGHSLVSTGHRSGDALLGSRAAVLRRSDGTRFSSRSDDEAGGYPARSAPAMFAPPICRRSRRNVSMTELILSHSRFVGFDEDGGSPANIAASGASH
jgi:hypothetical protein